MSHDAVPTSAVICCISVKAGPAAGVGVGAAAVGVAGVAGAADELLTPLQAAAESDRRRAPSRRADAFGRCGVMTA